MREEERAERSQGTVLTEADVARSPTLPLSLSSSLSKCVCVPSSGRQRSRRTGLSGRSQLGLSLAFHVHKPPAIFVATNKQQREKYFSYYPDPCPLSRSLSLTLSLSFSIYFISAFFSCVFKCTRPQAQIAARERERENESICPLPNLF